MTTIAEKKEKKNTIHSHLQLKGRSVRQPVLSSRVAAASFPSLGSRRRQSITSKVPGCVFRTFHPEKEGKKVGEGENAQLRTHKSPAARPTRKEKKTSEGIHKRKKIEKSLVCSADFPQLIFHSLPYGDHIHLSNFHPPPHATSPYYPIIIRQWR